jgi:hypothetical protein
MPHLQPADRVAVPEAQVRGDRPEPEQAIESDHGEAALLRPLFPGQHRSVDLVDRDPSSGQPFQLGDATDVIDVAVRKDDVAKVARLAPDAGDEGQDALGVPGHPVSTRRRPSSVATR